MSSAGTQTAQINPSLTAAQALVADDSRWKQVANLPCHISVEVKVPGFTLKDLLALGPKAIVRSLAPTSASPPLRLNGEVVARGDFEVLGKRLAVRLTELA